MDEQAQTIAELERELKAVKAERDELTHDVEQLCMSRGSSMFSSSYVMSEKLVGMDTQLKQLRMQLRSVTAERDDLAENIQQCRAAKHQSDVGWQAEQKRSAALERELSFYQSSSAMAMADRDRATFEADELRRQVASLEGSLRAADQKAQAERFQKDELSKQLAETSRKLEDTTRELRARLSECAQLPEVKAALTGAQRALEGLKAAHADLQEQLRATEQALADALVDLKQSQLEAVRLREQLQQEQASASQAQEAAAAQATKLKEHNAALQRQVNEQAAHMREQDTLLEQTSAALISAQAGVKELQASKEGGMELLRQEGAAQTAQLQEKLSHAETSLSQTSRERDTAQQALEQLRATASENAAAVESLTQRSNDLKVRLAAATQEKVEALLKAASAAPDARQQGSSAASSPVMPDGLHSTSEHEWDVPRSTHSDEWDGSERLRALEHQVVLLEERLANIGRLLPLAHRYRGALQALGCRLMGQGPEGGKAGAKGAQESAVAELNHLADECKALRQKLGLTSAAAEQEDVALCQQLPAKLATDAAIAAGADAGSRKGAMAAVLSVMGAMTGKAAADAGSKAGTDTRGKDASSNGHKRAAATAAQGEKASSSPGAAQGDEKGGLIAAALAAQDGKDAVMTQDSNSVVAGRLDRALAREVLELVSFGIGAMRTFNQMSAYNQLLDF